MPSTICKDLHSALRRFLLLVVAAELVHAQFKIKLQKQQVPVISNGRVVLNKSAYFGTVFVGLPEMQEFTAVFDTGSGHFFLPSSECKGESCLIHRRYDQLASVSATNLNHDGKETGKGGSKRDKVSINYGTGSILGDFALEFTCVDRGLNTSAADHSELHELAAKGMGTILAAESFPEHCTRLRMIMADEMSTEPFRQFAFDGVVGLGLSSLALHRDFHFFTNLVGAHPQMHPIFGFYISNVPTKDSEITFGGFDQRRFEGALQWSNVVNAEDGYWRIRINGVRVGNTTLDLCASGKCTAIVDSGTSLLGIPKQVQRPLVAAAAREAVGATSAENVDCVKVPGPPLVFDMGDFELELDASDFTRPRPTELPASGGNGVRVICQPLVLPFDLLDGYAFLMGEPILKKYYTAYDTQLQRVGFAVAL